MAVMAVSCSTGVESIGRITERDVARYGEKPSSADNEIVEIARNYIKEKGGFEKFAEWGLV